MLQTTAEPGTCSGRSIRKISEGLVTSFKPASFISNTPISLVEPKRFFTARRMRKAVAALAFEVKHGVDHVLEQARSGDGAVFGHVADQKSRQAGFFGKHDDRAGCFPHLGDAAGRRRNRRRENRLHRVDHEQAGFDFFDMIENALERSLAQDEQIGRLDAEPLGAHFDLPRRFFAGHVETREPCLAHGGKRLQQQGRFADAGVAADEDHRAGHEAAAEDAVELADARRAPGLLRSYRFRGSAPAPLSCRGSVRRAASTLSRSVLRRRCSTDCSRGICRAIWTTESRSSGKRKWF